MEIKSINSDFIKIHKFEAINWLVNPHKIESLFTILNYLNLKSQTEPCCRIF